MKVDTPWDYVMLSLQLIVTIALLALTTYVTLIIDHLRSVMNRDTLMTSCITAALLIWMWSAFVSNQHLSIFLPANSWGCALWDFWLQYALGLNLVFTLVIIKLNWYRLVREHRQDYHMRQQTLACAVAGMLPTLLVCAGVEYNGGTSVDPHSQSCRADNAWKIALTSCLLLNYGGVLALLTRGLLYKYITRDHRELLYGAVVASAALLLILVLNFARQTGHVYGRLLTALAINCTAVSLFCGLIGLPIYHSLKENNKYELAVQLQQTDLRDSSQIQTLRDLLPYPPAYEHYIGWIKHRHMGSHNGSGRPSPHCVLSEKRDVLPSILVPPDYSEGDVQDFRQQVKLCSKDPETFLFNLEHMVQLLERLDVMQASSRPPDAFWKKSIETTFIKTGAEKRVPLPYNLQQELTLTAASSVQDYKNLLLCTKLWLLAQLQYFTWEEYVQDQESGLPSFQATIKSDYVQDYLREDERLREILSE